MATLHAKQPMANTTVKSKNIPESYENIRFHLKNASKTIDNYKNMNNNVPLYASVKLASHVTQPKPVPPGYI